MIMLLNKFIHPLSNLTLLISDLYRPSIEFSWMSTRVVCTALPE